jgi:MFS family permease
MSTTPPNDAYGAIREKNFLLFTLGTLVSDIGRQMLTVGIGWDIYERTHSAMALGFVGLAQMLPVLVLTLPAGQIVDLYDRKMVLRAAQLMNALATAGLLALSLFHGSVEAMYVCLFLAGVGRSFHRPANSALLPQIVSANHFTNAVAWSSMSYQTACIAGPMIGGLIIGVWKTASPVYFIDLLGCLLFWLALRWVKPNPDSINNISQAAATAETQAEQVVPEPDTPVQTTKKGMTWQSLLSGVVFVWKTPMILAAITLDMFAVLFGGAVALLPVYAKDILHVGPSGLGWLQAAPSLGALSMGFVVARCGQLRQTGKLLLGTIIGFGVVTIVFGLSKNFALSLAMLILTGMFDNISVVIRQSLVQLRTPDAMRGRVSAINYVFIGASNELGGFESGLTAHFWGPVASVVFGGFATIATVFAIGFMWPELLRLDRLQKEEESSEPVGCT